MIPDPTPDLPIETEIKLRIPAIEPLIPDLAIHGFWLETSAQEERSVLWDRGTELLEQGSALRLRSYGGRCLLTWKGPKREDPLLKIRPEIETLVENPAAMDGILRALGYAPVMSMEKTRAVWRSAELTACLDETPFGCFLELEGAPEAIEQAMDAMGLEALQVEPRSYPTLFREQGLA